MIEEFEERERAKKREAEAKKKRAALKAKKKAEAQKAKEQETFQAAVDATEAGTAEGGATGGESVTDV